MKFLISILFIFISITSTAQFLDTNGNLIIDGRKYLKSKVDTIGRKSGWEIYGTNTLTINQNTFSNWTAGGENSVSFIAKVDYELNYRKKRNLWDNRFIMEYGFLDNKTNGTRKTSDNINITSSYGYLLKKSWYLTSSVNFRSQFAPGYDYGTTPKTKKSNLFSPAYVTLGIGGNYNPSPDLSVSIHPITSRTTVVMDEDLKKKGNYGLREDGDALYFEIGAYIGARYKVKLFENVTYDNNIGLFSNYSNKPLHIDLVYAGVLNMKINNFMNTQLTINIAYDEDQIKATQFKQTLGIGLTYKIDSTKKKEKRRKNKKDIKEVTLDYIVAPYINNHKPIDSRIYNKIFEKDEVNESSIYLKSETILNELL
ncbi:DUF3078 domain-containing protein [Faecalibacter rhinopitheci]|uniref:DUF3078 domain-containing protein n=1 Tax=Faecalibacter rhinopitheci TaxID=2779678 RepID=A0A8J7G5D9_9FLAO|nr:DUF3078 domain-containing protein [Faecalibacter rhinopitheci]MBF0596495.1 DUF3078 domain-containing protein [Faecalibacter rhinopitheci]MBQ0147615.1 DUF3078 domain-containing protein [Candidatus Onthonaster equi]